MGQAYSDPERELEPHALPDVEVYFVSDEKAGDNCFLVNKTETEPGWYWWSCFPGCLPESDPVGPFPSESLAKENSQDRVE